MNNKRNVNKSISYILLSAINNLDIIYIVNENPVKSRLRNIGKRIEVIKGISNKLGINGMLYNFDTFS